MLEPLELNLWLLLFGRDDFLAGRNTADEAVDIRLDIESLRLVGCASTTGGAATGACLLGAVPRANEMLDFLRDRLSPSPSSPSLVLMLVLELLAVTELSGKYSILSAAPFWAGAGDFGEMSESEARCDKCPVMMSSLLFRSREGDRDV
jgi:hypothetical protein